MTANDLKNSILQLAIQGKLVPQNPEDEPASELLKRIKADKAKLIADGKIKKEKPLSPITPDEIPFDIPSTWEWVRINSLSKTVTKGTTPRDGNVAYLSIGVGFLRAENIAGLDMLDMSNMKYIELEEHTGNLSRSIIEADDILVTIAGTLGRTALVRENNLPLNANQAVSIIRLVDSYALSLKYLIYSINSPIIQKKLIVQKKTTSIPNLTLEIISNCMLPIPPLAEQQRIVAKIEELLPFIEEYDKAEKQLTKLNAEFPDKLRKSILQQAVQGKLTEQLPTDEPASELLKRIKAEKAKLIADGKIKKEKPLFPITPDEIPFDIPSTWEWGRLSEIVYNHGQKMPNIKFCYIDIGTLDNKHQKLCNNETIINPNDAPSRARKIVKKGDIIYATVRPYLHNTCIIDKDFSCEPIASTGFAVFATTKDLYNRFLFYYLLSPDFDNYANDTGNARGVAYPAINDDKLYKAIIPIPPLAEQQRIVDRVEELFSICDNLN